VGYEVIDEHGTVAAGGGQPVPPTRASVPYDLGELEPATPPSDVDEPDAPHTAPQLTAPLTSRRARLERVARRPAVLASIGVLVGALLGGYVVHQHAAGEAQAEARSVINAVAVAENQLATGVNGVRLASLTVRLTNFGPRAVEPVLSPSGHEPTQLAPLVEATTPNASAAPSGGSTLVMMSVPLACGQQLSSLHLPVRTADHKVHQVDVRSVGSEALQQDRTMCGGDEPPQSFVTATLEGTIDSPYLQFTNQAGQARRIWLQEPTALRPMTGVTIVLASKLPHDIEPHGTFRLGLSVRVASCTHDVAKFEQAQVWLGFLDSDIGRNEPPTEADWQNVMGSSVGSVITAAMLKACT
jgi:hypothetical protein